jgi:hypothetical protein
MADDAGYSTGAVYSKFRDKPTQCRAVVESVHTESWARSQRSRQRSVNPHASIDPASNALRAAAAVLVPGRDFSPAGGEKAQLRG